MTIAICFYGKPPTNKVRELINEKFKEFEFIEFESYDSNEFKSLLDVSFKKRDYEIENNINFSACIAINSTDTDAIKLLHPLRIKIVTYNVIYFIKGCFDETRYRTGINPEIFYATSLTFDRICEYYTNLKNLCMAQNPSSRPEEVFYFHIKSLLLKAKCIDYENSGLFIRTT